MLTRMDRHLGLTIWVASTLVLFVFLLVSLIFSFVGEITNKNLLSIHMLTESLSELPHQIQVLLPFCLFIGTLVGLGNLANANELSVFRTAGVSVYRLYASAVVAVMVLYAILYGTSELLLAKQSTKQMSSTSVPTGNTSANEWIKEGNTFSFIRDISDKQTVSNVTQFGLDDSSSNLVIRRTPLASYDATASSWRFSDVNEQRIEDDSVINRQVEVDLWSNVRTPEMFLKRSRDQKPKELSIWQLYEQVVDLQTLGESSKSYSNELWTRVARIVTTIGLVLLSFTFLLGSTRELGMGARIALGLLIGLSFHILQDFFAPISLVFDIHPLVNMGFPLVLLFGIAVIRINRVA